MFSSRSDSQGSNTSVCCPSSHDLEIAPHCRILFWEVHEYVVGAMSHTRFNLPYLTPLSHVLAKLRKFVILKVGIKSVTSFTSLDLMHFYVPKLLALYSLTILLHYDLSRHTLELYLHFLLWYAAFCTASISTNRRHIRLTIVKCIASSNLSFVSLGSHRMWPLFSSCWQLPIL